MPDHQCRKLAPAGKGTASACAIELRLQALEVKSRHALEKLTKYLRIGGHSPITRFDSINLDMTECLAAAVCDDSIRMKFGIEGARHRSDIPLYRSRPDNTDRGQVCPVVVPPLTSSTESAARSSPSAARRCLVDPRNPQRYCIRLI